MGITGLIPFLEKATESTNISKFRGKVLAIDSYCLLHKGVYSCAFQLVQGQKTTKHIDYCLKYVNLLLSWGIKPILVFDGQDLPAKRETNSKRREQRNLAKSRASELLRLGKMDEARKHLNAAVDVTHQMAHELMIECRKINVDCITAPYESDSQLCYLNLHGIADVVVSEDSDLVLFGCTKVLFKLSLDGTCLFFDAEKLHLTMNCSKEKFSFDKFRTICVLSGCDYLNSLPGIGLAKAFKFVTMTEETDMKKALKKIPSYLNMRKLEVTEEYIENFLKAIATFKYMFVFDPIARKMVRLNDLDLDSEEIQYCGNAGILLDDKTAFQLALGNIDPHNLSKVLDNFDPDRFSAIKDKSMRNFCNFPSIWRRSGFQEAMEKKKSPLRPRPAQSIQKMEAELYEVYRKENELETFDETDLIMKYSSPVQQQAKRLKTSDETPRKPYLNPFFKKDIERGGNNKLGDLSLIKQTKFSFKKTVVDENIRVRSRFFKTSEEKEEEAEAPGPGSWISEMRKQYECSTAEKKLVLSKEDQEKARILLESQKCVEEREMEVEVLGNSSDSSESSGKFTGLENPQNNNKESPSESQQANTSTNLEDSLEEPTNLQRYRTPEAIHSEPSDTDPGPSVSPEPDPIQSKSSDEGFKSDSQKSDTSCDLQTLVISESIDVETYAFKSMFSKAKSSTSTSTNVKKTGCKRPGLAKPKSSSSLQMKLSSFGFQKKPTI